LTLQLWTGEPAEMSTEPGSEFSLWDGSIVGKNISFEPGKSIVQQWYFGEQSEPSIVTIKLHPAPQGTSVESYKHSRRGLYRHCRRMGECLFHLATRILRGMIRA
jgi:activator of HSP90 ATPase